MKTILLRIIQIITWLKSSLQWLLFMICHYLFLAFLFPAVYDLLKSATHLIVHETIVMIDKDKSYFAHCTLPMPHLSYSPLSCRERWERWQEKKPIEIRFIIYFFQARILQHQQCLAIFPLCRKSKCLLQFCQWYIVFPQHSRFLVKTITICKISMLMLFLLY